MKYKKGDKVRILATNCGQEDFFSVGDICEVAENEDLLDFNVVVYSTQVKGEHLRFTHNEIELVNESEKNEPNANQVMPYVVHPPTIEQKYIELLEKHITLLESR